MALRSDEGFPDAEPVITLNRNILQIRLCGREPSCGSNGLIQRGMEPPGLWIDQEGQCIDVRGLQLADAAAIQDVRRQLMLGSELCQGLVVR